MSGHNIFYIPSSSFGHDQVIIEGPYLRHIKSVLRKKAGGKITLTDGQGNQYQAELYDMLRDKMTAKIIHQKKMPRRHGLEIALGFVPVKGLRNDLVIEKGTELGVTGFFVFSSEYAVVKNIGDQKIGRWKKIAQSAMCQSRQYYLPEVTCVPSLHEMLSIGQGFDLTLVADACGTDEIPDGMLKILLLIGPEGGFSESERELLEKQGASFMSLGPTRLRSETAAIVGVSKILTVFDVL
ncbi:MAG: RsmE family RNA methyltransferase [candidate division WOR-3 bacterium]|jgi:16S rRNA (uracil1498-N3)-methyltransferase